MAPTACRGRHGHANFDTVTKGCWLRVPYRRRRHHVHFIASCMNTGRRIPSRLFRRTAVDAAFAGVRRCTRETPPSGCADMLPRCRPCSGGATSTHGGPVLTTSCALLFDRSPVARNDPRTDATPLLGSYVGPDRQLAPIAPSMFSTRVEMRSTSTGQRDRQFLSLALAVVQLIFEGIAEQVRTLVAPCFSRHRLSIFASRTTYRTGIPVAYSGTSTSPVYERPPPIDAG